MSKRKEPTDFTQPSFLPKVVRMSRYSSSSAPLSLPYAGSNLARMIELRHEKRAEDGDLSFKPANQDVPDKSDSVA